MEASLIFSIAYTPRGNRIVGAAPLAGAVYLFLLPFAVGMVLLEEVRKWLALGKQPRRLPGDDNGSRPPRLADPGSPNQTRAP